MPTPRTPAPSAASALWSAWLSTPEGSEYAAGRTDLAAQLHAARGREWVAERLRAADAAEIERLEGEVALLRKRGILLCEAIEERKRMPWVLRWRVEDFRGVAGVPKEATP